MKSEATPQKFTKNKKRNDILRSARRLSLKKGFENTSVRQPIKAANTSTGNLYFHFPNKLEILKVISLEFLGVLREQTYKIKALSYTPEKAFALDLRIGYITAPEDPKLSKPWVSMRNVPDIHQCSIQNKKLRLQAFFGDRVPAKDLDSLAIAIQGIAE